MADTAGGPADMVGVDRRLAVAHDVTEQRRLESAVSAQAVAAQDSEQLLACAFDGAPIGMSAIDREGHWLRVNDAYCRIFGYQRAELLAMSFRDLTDPDDALRTMLGRTREEPLEGSSAHYQAEKRYLRPDGSIVWAAIHVTPVHNADGSVRAFCSQVIDITEAKLRGTELHSARLESLRRLAIASEYRDDDTHEHTERVARMAVEIGRRLEMTETRLELLRQAAPLHDIGKIGISDAILFKPGRLTSEERQAMERHTLIGADILSKSDSDVLQMAQPIALTHHERWDGEGYPNRLGGEAIPLVGRIVAIADVFDALTHSRPYKEAWSMGRAVAHIRGESGRQFDANLVAVFANIDHARLAFTERAQATEPGAVGDASTGALTRGRAVPVPESEKGVSDRAHTASERDRAASERDQTATERDQSEAEADERAADRDRAASVRDRRASERDQTAAERDQFEAKADGRTAHREQAASERELAAYDRDQTATVRDQSQARADRRTTDTDPEAATPSESNPLLSERRNSDLKAEQRTSDRGRAADDRERAASDRHDTASDRDQSQKEAEQRTFNRDDAAEDREHASADRVDTAADRDHSEAEADQRDLDRGHSAASRVLAAADRQQTAADRRAATIDRDHARDELRRAQVDQLTGALGRERGLAALGREIRRARRGNGRLTLAFADVNGLKQVNERQGHAAGDVLLREVVGAMQVHLGSHDPIVRLSGDEFVCALRHSLPEDAARRFAEIHRTLEQYHPGASISVGFAALRPSDTLQQLTDRADAALHEARAGDRA